MSATGLTGNVRPTTVLAVPMIAVMLLVFVGAVPLADPAAGSTQPTFLEGDHVDAEPLAVRLTAGGPTVEEMVDAVRRQAHRTPGADGDAAVAVVLSGDLARELGDETRLLAGLQRGSTAYVSVRLAWPERTVIHEVAHVMTDGDGHGEVWRAVYLGAMAELYGADVAHREWRRVAWVYDRCYLTDSCPQRPHRDPPPATDEQHDHP